GCRAIAGIEDLHITTCNDRGEDGLPPCSCDGGPCSPEPVLGQDQARNVFLMRADRGKLFLFASRTVESCSADACATTLFELYDAKSNHYFTYGSVAEDGLYLAEAWGPPSSSMGALRFVSRNGVQNHELVTGLAAPTSVEAAPGRLYWSDPGPDTALFGKIGTCSLPACSDPKTIASDLELPSQVFVDGADVLVTAVIFPGNVQTGALYRCSPGATCATRTMVYAGPGLGSYPFDIALAGGALFVPATYFDKRESAIYRIDGDGTATLLATDPGLFAVAATTDAVYWTNPDEGTVKKLSYEDANATPVVLARNQGLPTPIAVDDTHVYWIDDADASAWRIPR
ncbi:MAG TPA: hypothetical protein VHB21_00980, partial [Minicystis sp.]|nr:hypothetical protein [Minicystis sp.]